MGITAKVLMADLELLYFDQEGSQFDPPNWSSEYQHSDNTNHSTEKSLCNLKSLESAFEDSAPRTAPTRDRQLGAIYGQLGPDDEDGISVYCEGELETAFVSHDRNVYLQQNSPQHSEGSINGSSSHSSWSELHEEDIPELYMLSDEELTLEASGKSVDYGFISAVTCLVTGISLVAISYTVPREVNAELDSVSAREMERLERESAQVGAHLDRCVIAGLCLLTLGGVVLSTLLMVSMWKGEMIRRRAFAYSKQSTKLYGSINLRGGSSPTQASSSYLSVEEGDLEVLS